MNTLQRTSLLTLTAALLLAPGPLRAQNQQKAAEPGARQFARNCAGCHGEDGRGGDKAPAIATMPSVIALSDAQLSRIVHNGTQNGMPAFPQLGNDDVDAVVHYLRTLQGQTGSSSVEPVTGNTDAGRTLFFGKAQCSTCHRAEGAGGFVASDLTAYGQSHNQDAIAKAIIAPDGLATSPPLIVDVRTKSGRSLSGAVRSEDNFNIELQTQDGGRRDQRYRALPGDDRNESSGGVSGTQAPTYS